MDGTGTVCGIGSGITHQSSDAELVAWANRRRVLHTPPAQSIFRVLCIMMVKVPIEEQGGWDFKFIEGLNFEPGNIGGSICAERSALGQLHLFQVHIHTSYSH